jgi:hypothetical protein
MLSEADVSIFTGSDSIKMLPIVSAEWNWNLFVPPYVTTAGSSVKKTVSTLDAPSVSTKIKENFNTYEIPLSTGSGSITYNCSSTGGGYAYKIITYVRTSGFSPVVVNTKAIGSSAYQIGAASAEIDSFQWTKIETFIGSPDAISSITFTIKADCFSDSIESPTLYFTEPEVYETTLFDYQYGSMWKTSSPFEFARPGESYIGTGNSNISLPLYFRGSSYLGIAMPISPVVYNPKSAIAKVPTTLFKNALPTNLMPYQYFVSDTTSRKISAVYEKNLYVNKLVLKFNLLMSDISIDVKINNSSIGTFTLSNAGDNGILVLYYNGTSWSSTPWTTIPKFDTNGLITPVAASVNSITIEKTADSTLNPEFSAYTTSTYFTEDATKRMHLIECSPRLEIDLTDITQEVNINKSLDSGSGITPISSINSNDASIKFSGIPNFSVANGLVPLLSNESSNSATIMKNMLKKNVKFYIHFDLFSSPTAGAIETGVTHTYIPGGVFYSDSWSETDIQDVNVQAYDVSKYLQTRPVPDYVARGKSILNVIMDILDLAGFTDYDYDSLYNACNNRYVPMDISYFFCNSKDTTVLDALAQIFLSYQIGAYIDEYGVMQFTNLARILTRTSTNISIDDSNIVENGYSLVTKPKPGKISVRYQPPKIKQSLSLQNTQDITKNSASFILTTSNDVVWSQENVDSVGFNYLSSNMLADSNSFTLKVSDLNDIFHTYSLDHSGYAAIEDEIVSFDYKGYIISNSSGASTSISVKNSNELTSKIDEFIKANQSTLQITSATITSATASGTQIVYNASNSFKVGQTVIVSGITPSQFNVKVAKITACDSSSFTVKSSITAGTSSGGLAVVNAVSDTIITPTGDITNVRRGLFGTRIKDHKILNILSDKDLAQGYLTALGITTGGTNAIVSSNKITVKADSGEVTIVYPNTDNNSPMYQTYSTKFEIEKILGTPIDNTAGGLFFNLPYNPGTGALSLGQAYFLEFSKKTLSANDVSYYLTLYVFDASGVENRLVATSDITHIVEGIIANFPQVLHPDDTGTIRKYLTDIDQIFNLRIATYEATPESGEVSTTSTIASVFLNNIEITKWTFAPDLNGTGDYRSYTDIILGTTTVSGLYDSRYPGYTHGYNIVLDGTSTIKLEVYDNIYIVSTSNPLDYVFATINSIDYSTRTLTVIPLKTSGVPNEHADWQIFTEYVPQRVNTITNTPKKIVLPFTLNIYTKFGMFTSNKSFAGNPSTTLGPYFLKFRELYATQTPLKDGSANYYHQSQEFLNGALMGKNSIEKTYMMQTKPEVVGVNSYDVQYTTPGAITTDVLPIEYLWHYFPGVNHVDQKYAQQLYVTKNSLSYSTPINTGFRGKMLIVNNSPHLIYTKHDSDAVNQFNSVLRLWTTEIIAPSDPQVVEKNIVENNASEVVQLDSKWIQSTVSANKVVNLIGAGLEGFSREVTLEIFGNPLIQIGDRVNITYSLNGISNQKYFIKAVQHSFSQGLSTKLVLNRIDL